MCSAINLGWNWLSRYSPWNAKKEISRGENLFFFQKIKSGFIEGVKNLPRAFALSLIANTALATAFPANPPILECLQAKVIEQNPIPYPVRSIGKIFLEEIVFRAGLQNWMKKGGIGLNKRILFSSLLFGAFHLNNLNNACVPQTAVIAQTILPIVSPIFTILYEKGGFPLSFSAHLANNLTPYLIAKAFFSH